MSEYRAENIDMVDLDNERRCLKRLKTYCEDSLSQYATSLEQDMELLAKDDKNSFLSFNERNCVLFR